MRLSVLTKDRDHCMHIVKLKGKKRRTKPLHLLINTEPDQANQPIPDRRKHSNTKKLYRFSPEAIVYFEIDCKLDTF